MPRTIAYRSIVVSHLSASIGCLSAAVGPLSTAVGYSSTAVGAGNGSLFFWSLILCFFFVVFVCLSTLMTVLTICVCALRSVCLMLFKLQGFDNRLSGKRDLPGFLDPHTYDNGAV